MSLSSIPSEPHEPFRLNVKETQLTNEQFMILCQENPEFRLELTAQKELIIMPPVGSETSWLNGRIYFSLTIWADKDGTGLSFDSSGGFTLPNGAIRSPDVSWVQRERWLSLTKDNRGRFAALCPDFVIELRSLSDKLSDLRAKMQEYIDNGTRLGWLIDPIERRVYVYRPRQTVEQLDNPTTLNGDPVLPGFVLSLQEQLVTELQGFPPSGVGGTA